MFTSGDRSGWLQTVASKIMDGGDNPPSIERLNLLVPRDVVTAPNDGHVTAARALGEQSRQDYRAGWRVIISEMVGVLREQGFVGGTDEALTWLKPVDGEWRVAMPDDPGRELTVFGQRELRMSRDRMIIGERSEEDGARIGVPSLFESGRIHPLELQVLGPRGGITTERFELHPLAVAIPPMTAAERETLRASIERDGVKVPIVIFEKKILDGRNRGYFASTLNKPVRIEEFTGTEDEARRHVAILNLHRRHLTSPQRSLAAIRLFGEQAREEATEAKETGYQKRDYLPLKTAEDKPKNRSGEWHSRVASMANDVGLNVKPTGIRSMKLVMDAPETLAKVESQEIATIARAAAEARAELGMPEATTFEGANHRTVTKHLGECIYHLNKLLNDLEMPVGRMPEKISTRLDEIDRLNAQLRQALRERKVIP